MRSLRVVLALLVLATLAGCGGSHRYGTGNPIAGYTDCDILEAEGSTICEDAYASARHAPAQSPPPVAAQAEIPKAN